jgi:GT2 family glycosyltransferase
MRTQTQNPELSLIVLNYDTGNLVRDCLKSIFEFPPSVSFEVLVVNNGSRVDRPQDFTAPYPAVTVLDLPENLGFGGGNNAGMEAARGNYFLLLSSDTYFVDSSLQIAWEHCRDHPTASIFGCTVLNPDGSLQPCCYLQMPKNRVLATLTHLWYRNPLVRRFLGAWDDFQALPAEQPHLVTNQGNTRAVPLDTSLGGLYGAYVLLKREVYEETGGFDPDFYMYCEETEWFRNRIERTGFRIAFCHQARVFHIGGASDTEGLRHKQCALSDYLFWYKMGYIPFAVRCVGGFLNLMLAILATPFVSPELTQYHYQAIRNELSVLPQAVRDIPRFSNEFGSRPRPLALDDVYNGSDGCS